VCVCVCVTVCGRYTQKQWCIINNINDMPHPKIFEGPLLCVVVVVQLRAGCQVGCTVACT
jgi:hypothetical protein